MARLPNPVELAASGIAGLVSLAILRADAPAALAVTGWSPAALLGVGLLLGRAAVYVVHFGVQAALVTLLDEPGRAGQQRNERRPT